MKICNYTKSIVLIGLLGHFSGVSFAASIGGYAGVGMGYAILDEQAPNEDKSDIGAKVYLGMRILGPLAIEAGYYYLGKYNNEQEEITGTSISAVGNVYTRSVNLFVKAGVFNWAVDDSAAGTSISDTDTTFGLGINVPIDKNMAIHMEWEHFSNIGKDVATSNSGQNMSLLSFGLNFTF